jgi:hypothetical protein
MTKTTIRNLGVTLKLQFRKSNPQEINKMNKLQPIMCAIADHHAVKNNLHIIKWRDINGHTNVAFQIVNNHLLDGGSNQIINSSLVFAQNDTDKIAMTIFHNTINGLKPTNEHNVMDSVGYDQLTESFIQEKINWFLNLVSVA